MYMYTYVQYTHYILLLLITKLGKCYWMTCIHRYLLTIHMWYKFYSGLCMGSALVCFWFNFPIYNNAKSFYIGLCTYTTHILMKPFQIILFVYYLYTQQYFVMNCTCQVPWFTFGLILLWIAMLKIYGSLTCYIHILMNWPLNTPRQSNGPVCLHTCFLCEYQVFTQPYHILSL